jgi:hypothetical protein
MRSFVLTNGHPASARGGLLRVNWRWPHPVCPGSPNSNAWSARQPAAASRHRPPRAPHGVPSQIDVRAHLAAHGSVDLGGAALAIETGSDFAIGPIDRSKALLKSASKPEVLGTGSLFLEDEREDFFAMIKGGAQRVENLGLGYAQALGTSSIVSPRR